MNPEYGDEMDGNYLIDEVRRASAQNKFIFDALAGRFNEISAEREAVRLCIQTENRSYVVVIFKSCTESLTSLMIDAAGLVQDRYRHFGQAWAICIPGELTVATIAFDAQAGGALDEILVETEELRNLLSRAVAREVISAIGNPVEKISQLNRAYESAHQSLELRSYLLQSQFRYAYDRNKIEIPACHYSQLQELEHAVELGNYDGIEAAITKAVDALAGDGAYPKKYYEHIFREIVFTIRYALVKYRGLNEEVLVNDVLYYEAVERLTDKKMLRTEIQRLLEQLFLLTEERSAASPLIQCAIQYIQENCTKRISLNSVAERLNISPAYFSRLFRQETGINYSAYLTRCRIEYAKTLLADPKLKIYEIAEVAGFKDVQYFNRVFRTITGASPNAYRHALRKTEE